MLLFVILYYKGVFMYYNNIYFHNVNLMEKGENGEYLLSRFSKDILFEEPKKSKKVKTVTNKETMPCGEPQGSEESVAALKVDEPCCVTETETVEPKTNEQVEPKKEEPKTSVLDAYKGFNALSLGVELRFKLVSNVVKIKLKLLDGQKPAVCETYFGNYFAGKDYTYILSDSNAVEIVYDKALIPAPNKKFIGFENDVVRLLLPTSNVLFLGVEGLTEVPQSYEMPTKNIIFLGSTGFGASEVDKPSLSIAFETAEKLNANCYNLCENLTEKQIKKLTPYINSFGKSCVIVSDLLTSEISDKNYRLQLRLIKRKIKKLSKFKKKILFVDYLFNYFNFKKPKRELKVKAKIAKMIKKKVSVSPYDNYATSMRLGVNELPAFATGQIVIAVAECIKEDFAKFNKKEKVSKKYVYYSIKTENDEPTNNLSIMTRKEKAAYLKARKIALKESKKRK